MPRAWRSRRATRHQGDDRDAADDTRDQGAGGGRLGGEVVLHGDASTMPMPCAPAGGGAWPDLHPSLRRPRRDRRPGHVGMEILRQHPGPIDAIFVPVGGGGLAAGIAAYVKFLRPDIKVIGVEPDDAACMHAAMAAGSG